MNFEPSSVIIRQHEEGNIFYIIESGEVICTQDSEESKAPVEVCRLGPGSYFGEVLNLGLPSII